MKIKAMTISLDAKISEFDTWVTPSIFEIKSTKKFQEEMEKVLLALDVISSEAVALKSNVAEEVTLRLFSHFHKLSTPNGGEKITDLQSLQSSIAKIIEACTSLIFIVTGKSDNNCKCQLPIFLRNKLNWQTIPKAKITKGTPSLENEKIPRILDSKSIATRVSSLYALSQSARIVDIHIAKSLRDAAFSIIYNFITHLISDEEDSAQLKEFIRYFLLCRKESRDPSSILTPLALFQVRGSVSASGGHEPEEILREKMSEWGLRPKVDFNTTDVVVDEKLHTITNAQELASVDKDDTADVDIPLPPTKTRAYDFVIPYRNPHWHPRIFIQSQFYAGDSGSVSHKNVDQTSATRRSTTKFFANWQGAPEPLFVEYLDGAGYCASLNGDLKRLLSLENTHDFFQIRSAPIRLRRVIQNIGFLTPLEVCHAIIQTNGNYSDLGEYLRSDGYHVDEIDRGIKQTLEVGAATLSGERLNITNHFFSVAAKYYVLDQIAINGKAFESVTECVGSILIPGFGPYFGIDFGELLNALPNVSDGQMKISTATLISDLAKSGEVVLR